MKGLYTEKISNSEEKRLKIIIEKLIKQGFIKCKNELKDIIIERFCDDGEGEINRYNVFKVNNVNDDNQEYVLKKSDEKEIFVYQELLEGKGFNVPKFYGSVEENDIKWILIEYIQGTDLRDFNKEMAIACAESITKVMNTYWQNNSEDFVKNKIDDRFERYYDRINERAKCLENEELIKKAYDVFIERQLICPRTLCNGDFLQFNGIYKNGKVSVIDWAFAGIMPYSLDIARLITHGTEDKRAFPFYMNDELRKNFIEEVYSRLLYKPNKEQYLYDIKLAMLNECVEFIEAELHDENLERDAGFEYYYNTAKKIAREIDI